MEANDNRIVLVMDDSMLICKQIISALKDRGPLVYEAHNGDEALEMVRQYQPDLILLDVVLPDTDGYELFNKLKAAGQENAVIIFLTSKDTDEDVMRGFSMGAGDYIKKPFGKAELQSRVAAHLKAKEMKDELKRQNKELRSDMEKLNYMAFRDGLTGLYNRRYVVGDLLEDIRGFQQGEQTCNVMILADIDDFKKVNDTYGHEAGDRALVCIAHILEGHCRKHKVVRWGGEEFLIVLLNVTRNEAFEISEQIRREVQNFPIFYNGIEFRCTLTLGLHAYQDQEGIEESIDRADKALYRGKRSGKNRSVWYENMMG